MKPAIIIPLFTYVNIAIFVWDWYLGCYPDYRLKHLNMKNVVAFLKDIKNNNDKKWFDAHKGEYLKAKEEMDDFALQLIDGIASFDESVKGLTLRDTTYRIYRDIRFSPDKTPYKTHMGVYVCKGGKKSGNAGYYFHVEPGGESLLGGNLISSGLYMPDPKALKSMREDILYNGEEFLAALHAAKGFELSRENSLKKVPSGYPADSPYAEYLKLKDVYLEKHFGDNMLMDKDLLKIIVDAFRTTYPLIEHLNRAVEYAREEM